MAAALAGPEPWAGVRAGLAAFLDACLEPEFRRIVVLDSVPVPSQDVWDGGIEHNELPMLRSVLTPLVEAYLPGVPVEPLVHVALGALYGAALYIARSPTRRRPGPRPTRCSTPSSPGSGPGRAPRPRRGAARRRLDDRPGPRQSVVRTTASVSSTNRVSTSCS